MNLPLNQIINGDCLEVMKTFPDECIDLIVTDPPYGISFMGKDWDSFNEVVNPQGAYNKVKGFTKLPRNKPIAMRKFFTPIWKETLRVLKPGGFTFIMCTPRQDCLVNQIISLQDAGFNTNFTSLYWTYASGFPKASNIGKMVDKKLGYERDITSIDQNFGSQDSGILGFNTTNKDKSIFQRKDNAVSNEAKSLDGSYTYNPKPAVEIIIVAQKPLKHKTFVNQALDWVTQRLVVLKEIEDELIKQGIEKVEWE